MAVPDITGNPYMTKGYRDELRAIAQPLKGAVGGAEYLARQPDLKARLTAKDHYCEGVNYGF